MLSPPPGSSNGEGVAHIAARINTLPSSPIAPDLPSIITTPTKFLARNSNSSPSSRYSAGSSGSTFKTPVHTNTNIDPMQRVGRGGRGSSSNLIPPNSNRQSFIQPPSSPSSLSFSIDGTSDSSWRRAAVSHQTVAAGLNDPKHFDFDAVSCKCQSDCLCVCFSINFLFLSTKYIFIYSKLSSTDVYFYFSLRLLNHRHLKKMSLQ